ncbi:thioesterase [Morchella snyderi]|nr:thioesterase [Morchella snyderi]
MSVKERKRSDYIFFLDYRTRWTDNDMYSHLTNTVYNVLIDSVVNTYLINHCGLNPATSPSIPLMVASQITFISQTSFPAVLDIGLRVNKLGNSSVTYECGVFEKGKDDVRAVGGYTHVFCDNVNRRPMAMEKTFREGLENLLVKEGPKL